MHSLSARWRKPKSRATKRSKAVAASKIRNTSLRNVSNVENNVSNEENTSNSNKNINVSESSFDLNSNNNINVSKSSFDLNSSANDHDQSFCDSTEHSKNTEKSISQSYIIINEACFKPLLQNLSCDKCDSNTLNVKVCENYGFSAKLELYCETCDKCFGSNFSSPRESTSKAFEVNTQMVRSFLSFGKGHAAMQNFSLTLGVSCIDSKTFATCLDRICERNNLFKKNMLKLSCDLVRDAHVKADNNLIDKEVIDITVSYDGTWQKRGHTSLYGIGCVIDSLTNLVVDYEILSKYCPQCVNMARDHGIDSPEYAIWQEGHSCQKNFAGSSGSMEVMAASILWKRSVSEKNFRYSTIICDGDSKTFVNLNEEKMYGPDVSITKEECINHVSKRLGTALRNKVKEWRVKKVTLGGRKKGQLTDAIITKLQNYYRKAIRENAPDLAKMKTSVLATLFHLMSTDLKPQHSKCPKGISSWCFYQRALSANEKPKSHKHMKTRLSETVVEKILPVYQRLASDELLKRCVSGKTQNANESLHSCIWGKCPKEVFISKKRLEYAVSLAVSEFNLSSRKTLELQKEIFFPNLSDKSVKFAAAKDLRRSNQRKRKSSESYKKCRIIKKYKTITKKRDNSYSAGAY